MLRLTLMNHYFGEFYNVRALKYLIMVFQFSLHIFFFIYILDARENFYLQSTPSYEVTTKTIYFLNVSLQIHSRITMYIRVNLARTHLDTSALLACHSWSPAQCSELALLKRPDPAVTRSVLTPFLSDSKTFSPTARNTSTMAGRTKPVGR